MLALVAFAVVGDRERQRLPGRHSDREVRAVPNARAIASRMRGFRALGAMRARAHDARVIAEAGLAIVANIGEATSRGVAGGN